MAAGVGAVGVVVVAGVIFGTTARTAVADPAAPATRVVYVSATASRAAVSPLTAITTSGSGSATALSVER